MLYDNSTGSWPMKSTRSDGITMLDTSDSAERSHRCNIL
jgi:hypothetical protein